MMPAITADTEETRYGRLLDLRLLSRFLAYVLPYRSWMVAALLLLPCNAGLQAAQPLIIKRAVDNHLVTGVMEGFGWWLLLLALLLLLQFGVGYLQALVNSFLGQRIVQDLRQSLFAHLLTLDAAFFSQQASGRLTNRLTNDIEAVSQMVSAGLLGLVGDLLLLAGIALSMVLLSPPLSLIALTALPLIIAATLLAARRLRLLQRQGRLLQSRMAGQLTEEIEGHGVVRLFQRQAHNHRQFVRLNRDYLDSAVNSNFWEAWQFSFVETASTIVIALLFLYGASDEQVTIGTLVAFIDYIRRIFFPIRDLSGKFTTMQAAMTALERIFSLLDTAPTIISPRTAQETPTAESFRTATIQFQDLWFDYGQGAVLNGISFTVAPGERVALVGPTGSGKSSLIKLLNRTYDVKQGAIKINGRDLRTLPLPFLRRMVGMVLQESFLFAGTIADNIGLHHPAIDRQRIQWAAEQTGAMRFIATLPQGLDSPLAERGANLSVGQRQLLGISRVLAFDPAILVMDEATSSVDTISERLIQQALRRLWGGRTALIVAHRLSTILDADRILVLSQGRIRETGTHAQLLAQGGLYAQLYALQFRSEEAEIERQEEVDRTVL